MEDFASLEYKRMAHSIFFYNNCSACRHTDTNTGTLERIILI